MSRRLADLKLVLGLVGAATIALLVPGVPWQIEWLFGFPLLLLLPGYALVAALFPERPDGSSDGDDTIGWPARFGLSLIGSAIVVAVVGVLLARVGWVQLTLGPAILLLAFVTVLTVGVAAIRRTRLPYYRRADPLEGVSFGTMTDSFGTTGTQSIALILSVIVLASALAFAGTSPPVDPHSEVYLIDGENVDVSPEDPTVVAGAENTVALTIANHEGETTDYDVVVRLQRVDENGTVIAEERLDDFEVGLDANETRVVERSLEPSMTGERLRLQVLVDKGDLDTGPGQETADLSLRLWVNATDGGAA